jgi:anti-sigma factor RsiW
MADQFTELLSDYLDGEDLTADARRRLEAHLAGCGECRTTLGELRDVAARAATLEDSPPALDLWPGVAARIGAGPPRRVTPFRAVKTTPRRFSFTLPQIVAASLALMVLSGGTVWLARSGAPGTDFEPVAAQATAAEPGAGLPYASGAETDYEQAVAELQRTFDAGRARLDPETSRVLESNLQTIDRAIDECRRALAADPSNLHLSTHLASAQRSKLTLLRRATALVTAQS